MRAAPVILTVYISKYALTQGVFKLDACISPECPDTAVNVADRGFAVHGRGKNWHLTRADALKAAEELRLRKIKALERQLKKLKGIRF